MSGDSGEKGEPGAQGFRGRDGEDGFPGVKGSKGEVGERGMPGDAGSDGMPGERGPQGVRGLQGESGVDGLPGAPGRNGRDGEEGPRGHTGEPGSPGSPGPSGKDGLRGVSRGDIVVVHSQSRVPPECPGQATKLWDGYSFVQSVAAGAIFGDDLGKPGSCMRVFTPTPFTVCHGSGKCSSTDDDNLFMSDWLANEQVEAGVEIPVHGGRDFVSRCSVCEAPGSVLTLHSQLTELPACPPSWESLWTGFSYWSGSPGQHLDSPGSCLKVYKSQPRIECNGNGVCKYRSNDSSFWIRAMEDQPTEEALNRVSRCQVCGRQ